MNILFVNYGDFTTNSLNHIGGFANALCASGHSCVVAVSHAKETIAHVHQPRFVSATYEEVLSRPALFPDNQPADIIHAWTPREGVRKFVLGYQRQIARHARLIVHLEDNERFLLEAFTGTPFDQLRLKPNHEIDAWLVDGLAHPLRHETFLHVADAITHIVGPLRQFAPPETPTHLLLPGVDFAFYDAETSVAGLRQELGIADNEKIIVYTGSSTFANEPELHDLYAAVALLNQRGTSTRLVRTGFSSHAFIDRLSPDIQRHVIDLGFVEKARLPGLLAMADVLVQPGRPGAFNDYRLPSKLPEFLAMGKPVILPATNLAGLMNDGIDGVFLADGSAEDIATKCERLFANPAACAALGRNAKKFARVHFDLTANTEKLAAFYTTTLARSPVADWSLLRSPLATEAAMVTALVCKRTASHDPRRPVQAEVELLANLVQQLDASLEHLRAHPGQPFQELSSRHEILQRHASELQRALENTRRLGEQHAANLEYRLKQAQHHTTNLEDRNRLTEQHVANLSDQLDTTRRTLHRLDEQHAVSIRQLARANEQFKAAEERQRQTQQHADNLERRQQALQQHANNLDQLRQALQERIQQLDAQCRHLESTIIQRDDLIAQRAAKIRTMEKSFSWQVTLPLRWLRRKLIDRKPPHRMPSRAMEARQDTPTSHRLPSQSPLNSTPAPQEPTSAAISAPAVERIAIVASVDNPQSWSLQPRKHVLRGWCFADDGRKLVGIRAAVGNRPVVGTYGFKRLDVFAAVRSKPQAEYCGWKIETELSTDDTELVLEALDEHGVWHKFFETVLRVGEGLGPLDLTNYEKWAQIYDTPSPATLLSQTEAAAAFSQKPLISVIMPVYNAPERWLERAVTSVRAQTYPNWELCIADDASPAPHVRPLLERFAREEPRIKVKFRPKNGHISAASNSALELVTGEYVALLDHDDELRPHALFEVVSAINARPDADFLYSDEDKIDEDGRRFEPYFKPDWQPDLFLGQNYTSHLTVYRTTLVREVGSFRPGYEGSQDWDLALRVSEKTTSSQIVHIPKVLYHWRAIAGSTALQLAEKNYPVEAARRALVDCFSRRAIQAQLVPVPGDHWRVQWPLPAQPPFVSLVIPTRNGVQLLRRCVDSILRLTTYPVFEIIVVDNGSDDPETLAYLASLAEGTHPMLRPNHVSRVLRYHAPFNYSAINNYAVADAHGTIIGLLNNDLEVINAEWLSEMVSHAVRPDIGCVGAMLYYPNETIQHAGIVLGVGGVAGHAFREFPRGSEGKFNRARLVQNYSAVTAACLVVRKSVYEEVGGLDEEALAVAFNDVDFCLKVRAAGYRNLWTPFAELYHHESATRGPDDTPEKAERFQNEVETMLRRWGAQLQNDPAYNPNLTLELNDFGLASPPAGPCSMFSAIVADSRPLFTASQNRNYTPCSTGTMQQ